MIIFDKNKVQTLNLRFLTYPYLNWFLSYDIKRNFFSVSVFCNESQIMITSLYFKLLFFPFDQIIIVHFQITDQDLGLIFGVASHYKNRFCSNFNKKVLTLWVLTSFFSSGSAEAKVNFGAKFDNKQYKVMQ